MRILIASFFMAHGLAHIVGFLAPSYQPSMLTDRLEAGAAMVKTFGALWLFAAMAFVLAGVGLAMVAPWWPMLTLGAVLFSLALSVAEWPRAQVGVYIDAAILMGLAFAAR
jgi:hypothetical protein